MRELKFDRHIRVPFEVQAIEITRQNMEQIAKLVGGEVVRERGEDPYILMDRTVIRNIGQAKVGWVLTRLGEEYRCYAPDIFDEHFVCFKDVDPNKTRYDITFEFKVDSADEKSVPIAFNQFN